MIRKTYRQKMKVYYIAGIFLLVLTACGNKTVDTVPQDNAEDTVCTEDVDNVEPETYEDDHVCVSEDGRITIESGIVPGSGTSPDYWAKWTITDNAGKSHIIMYPETSYQSNVHAITKTDDTVYYIVNCSGKASSTDGYEWLQAYMIVGDTIQEVNVADGGKEIDNNDFDINYYIPSWYFATNGAGYDWILEYDARTKSLYVPIIENREILDRYRVWRFNGERFVYISEQPHKDLHKNLDKYNRLICYLTTKDYTVRIDSLDSHELRYASWKKPKTMNDEPDLIIKGGKRRSYAVASNELCPCDDYRFNNGSFEYVVNYCEITEKENGPGEHHDFLFVKQNGNVVMKQEFDR